MYRITCSGIILYIYAGQRFSLYIYAARRKMGEPAVRKAEWTADVSGVAVLILSPTVADATTAVDVVEPWMNYTVTRFLISRTRR